MLGGRKRCSSIELSTSILSLWKLGGIVLKRLWWFWKCDRLGPDIPVTHLLLHFRRSSLWICRKKFRQFGDNSEFRPYAFAVCPSLISVGRNVIIRPGTMLFAEDGQITIEDDVLIGPGVHFYVNNHLYGLPELPTSAQSYSPGTEIRLCKGSWIGANAILLPGVTVGQNAVVAAGSVVRTSVSAFTMVAGNPARIKKTWQPPSNGQLGDDGQR